MSATQPIGVPTPVTGEASVRAQLDALSKGEIDPNTFLSHVKERARSEPDYDWEVLSLLDQYYRRGKIELEVFRTLKNGFAEYILGPKNNSDVQTAAPSPAPQAPTLHSVVTPPPRTPAPQVAAPAPAPVKSAPPSTMAPAAPAPRPAPRPAPQMAAPAPIATAAPMPAAAAPPPRAPAQATSYNYTVQGAAPPAPSQRASAHEPAREARVGDVLRNRYRLELLIGKGTAGNVFEASDPLRLDLPPVGKRVAIKVMHPDPRGIYIDQLRQEYHHLTTLSHPNIVRAFDFDRDGALAFFTMELLSGEHLFNILRTRAAPLERAHAFAIIRDVGDAVAHAHSRGIVHGDINPRNVFITQRGEVRVLRFGAWNRLSGHEGVSAFEQASAVPDTGRYASCEVLHGNRPNESDDLYSLSCLAYLLLTGRHAYADRTSIEARAERKHPRRPVRLAYRQWLALRDGLQTDSKKRPTDVRAWLDAMELGTAAKHLPATNELTAAPTVKSSRWQWGVAALLIVALIGGGYWFYTESGTFGGQPMIPPTVQEAAPPAPVSAPATGTAPNTAPSPGTPATQRPVAAPPVAQRPVPAAAPRANSGVPASGSPVPRSAALPPAAAAPGMAAAPASTARSTPVSQVPARVEMAADTLDASPTDSVVRVTVRRKGNMHGPTSFTWWTESGTAKPGVDFAPVLPHVLQMPDGESVTVLSVVLLPSVRSQEKGFYVGIEEADGGAQIGARSLTQITLPPTN
jgi:hypothetical protein